MKCHLKSAQNNDTFIEEKSQQQIGGCFNFVPIWEESDLKQVVIYTDGSCKNNPGPGGWAAILQYGTVERVLSGGEAKTTNNRMELTAVIEALSALKERCSVTLYSDSRYVIDGISKGWVSAWRAKGWKKSDGKPALNPELWQRLLELLERQQVTFVWVKGHADNPGNERCDALAQAEAAKFKKAGA